MIVALVTAIGYAGLTLASLWREGRASVRRRLTAYTGFSVVFAGLFVALELGLFARLRPEISPARVLVGLYLLGGGLLGLVTFKYLGRRRGWIWLAISLALAAGVIALDVATAAPGLGKASWRAAMVRPQPSPAALGAFALWLLGSLALMGLTLNSLKQASLPLHANRILFWLIAVALIPAGEAAVAWGDPPATAIGQAVRLAGVACAAYAVVNDRLVDLRSLARSGVGNAVLVLVTAAVTLLGIGLAQVSFAHLTGNARLIAVAAVALILALAYQLLRGGVEQLVNQTVLLAGYDAAQVARDYSRRVANILDFDQLSRAAAQALGQSVNARRAALLLLTPQEDTIDVRAVLGIGYVPAEAAKFSPDNPVLMTLAQTRRPLLQYDIDVNPSYRLAPDTDRAWLQSMSMDVFVPVMDGSALSGLLAVGPRASGDPYRQGELDVLTTIAEQTAGALKNARLFADLKTLNEQMQMLNESLQTTNEKLAAIDAAKSDFITIASHELRTPLTQLRGYTDVLSAMNKAEILRPEAIEQVTGSLINACDRLDQVIGQMLDVSQIDAAAMTFRFAQTTMNLVLRSAVDSFAAAMRERRQTLIAQGLRSLPAIVGDYPRLAQAFGAIICNAVKFTPDAGRIDIMARTIFNNDDTPEAVEVIVADTGVGVDTKYQELIFEKFFQVGSTALHSTGATKFMGAGPGLGLPLARGVIEGHGGKIWVESPGFSMEKMPGSRFHVRLPLVPPQLEDSEARREAREAGLLALEFKDAEMRSLPLPSSLPPPGK